MSDELLDYCEVCWGYRPRIHQHDRGEVVRPAPDPERDARVAARRADDARRAGRALDRLLIPRETYCGRVGVCPGASACRECSHVN